MKPYYDQDGITIYHADCREILPDLSLADLLITDPPYGIGYQSNRGNSHHGNPPIAGDDGTLDIEACVGLALRRLTRGRHFYVFGPLEMDRLTVGATTQLIWDKGHLGMGNLNIPWASSHETITFGVWSTQASHKGNGGLSARLRRGTVLHVPQTGPGGRRPGGSMGGGAVHHPTAKPVMLIRQLIESSSLIGETVLDPFMGAGSTLIAAQLEGRKAIGIEIEERYCETAVSRLAQGVLTFGDS